MNSLKDERYIFVEALAPDGGSNCVIVTEGEVLDSSLFLIEGRPCRLVKSDTAPPLLISKPDGATESLTPSYQIEDSGGDAGQGGKREVHMEKLLSCNSALSILQFNCAVCQNVCVNCKNICVTCKSPCKTCNISRSKTSSTHTDDFDKYLESLNRKTKTIPKVRTTGTDTCDLESHFDFYKCEKKKEVILKTVSTDCSDFWARKIYINTQGKSISVDTSDLTGTPENHTSNVNTQTKIINTFEGSEDSYSDTKDDNIDVGREETSKTVKTEETENFIQEIEENWVGQEETINNNSADEREASVIKKVSAEEKSIVESSDESDLDLETSGKIWKITEMVKKSEMTLSKIDDGESQVHYRCDICMVSFTKKYLCRIHLADHLAKDQFKCIPCNMLYASLESLRVHIKEKHASNSISIGTDESINEKDKEATCDLCGKVFSSKVLMLNHRRFHTTAEWDFVCKSCDPVMRFPSKESLYFHERLVHTRKLRTPRQKKEFICLICGKEFKGIKALTNHSTVHTGEKKYPCDICNKSYSSGANLLTHKKIHTGQKNFKCNVCGKAFHKNDTLKVHLRKHTGERPFVCDLCPMTFDRNYILKNHRLTHFPEKTFICPICGKAFTTHGGLNNHEKSHSRETRPRKPAVKPTLDTANAVICDVCGKIYSTKSNLRMHKIVHLGLKPYSCPVCGKSYAKKDSMQTHMRKHTDERPFGCEICGMMFYRNHTLKTHKLRHTGERPHKCGKCGKTFTQSSSLQYHVKHHDRSEKRKGHYGDDYGKSKKRIIDKQQGIKKSPKKVKEEEEIDVLSLTKKPSPEVDLNDKTRNEQFVKHGYHFMVPVSDKNVGDKGCIVEARSSDKVVDIPIYSVETGNSPTNKPKFTYYITKEGHIVTMGKDSKLSKDLKHKSDEVVMDEERNLLTSDQLQIKHHLDTLEVQKSDLKIRNVFPPWHVPGEVINSYVNEEPNDIIPYNSTTLQTFSTENLINNSIILNKDEDIKRRTYHRSKSQFGLPVPGKTKMNNEILDCKMLKDNNNSDTVLNLKDNRSVHQRDSIFATNPLPSVQIHPSSDVSLHSIPGAFYTSLQGNNVTSDNIPKY